MRAADTGAHKGGVITLDCVTSPRLVVECRRCTRKGDYRVSTMRQRFGERASLVDILRELSADCPRAQKVRRRIYSDMCEARWVDVAKSIG